MRSFGGFLAALCLLLVFTFASWADPPLSSATVFGSISGRNGTNGEFFFFSPGSRTDFDSGQAEVLDFAVSGGSGSNSTGSLEGRAFTGRKDDDPNGPGFIGARLVGSVVATRQATGGRVFLAAGNITAGVSTISEFVDEVTLDVPGGSSSENFVMEGLVYLEGESNLQAVATGTFDPNNVRVRVGGQFTYGDDEPVKFGAEKRGTGEIIVPPGAESILNPLLPFTFSQNFTLGEPSSFRIKLEMSGIAEIGDGTVPYFAPGSALASFEAVYLNTLRWGGITKIYNQRTGEEVTDYSISSASGFDYTQTFAIPEPSSVIMLSSVGVVGGVIMLLRRRKV